VFVLLAMGMSSIHFSEGLFNLVREWLPSPARPVVMLPRRQGLLLFHERGRGGADDGLRLGLIYLGLSDGKPRFRLDIELDGDLHRLETTAAGRWEVLGRNGGSPLLARYPELRDRGNHLAVEIMDADQQRVRLRVISSMRPTYEGAWDTAGLNLADLFALSDSQAELIGWMMRQGRVSLAEAAAYAGRDEAAVRVDLEELARRGFVAEVGLEGEPRYEARSATRRGRQLPQQIWQALGEERDSPPNAGTSRSSQATGISEPFRKLLSSEYGVYFLAAGPTAAAFLLAEWQILRGSVSFTGLLGVIGAVVVPLLGGIFPVLLVVASRQKGERVPGVVYRFLGNPLLLVGIYVLFLISIFVHGLAIWEDPVQRGGALLVGATVIGMTIAVTRRGAFARRLTVELREDQSEGEKAHFSVTAAGRPVVADVRLKYAEGEERYDAAAGEIPAIYSLRQASFRVQRSADAPTQLKVWAHKVTPEGYTEGIAGLLHVRQGEVTKRFDLKLSKGQVVLQVASGAFQVDITLAEGSDTPPGELF
jgi:predicted transcriptional regulator